MRPVTRAALALAVAAACSGPALAQNQPNKPVAPGQDAAERTVTAELNAQVAARNEAAAEAELRARADYQAALASRAASEADYDAALAARQAAAAEAEAAHEARMEMWRAQVVACENGVRLACAPVQPDN